METLQNNQMHLKYLPSVMKNPRNAHSAFTLVELVVSCALIVAILGLLLTSVDQTRRVVNSTTARVAQFQAARAGFDAMTRNLSQATLNTYWDLDFDPASGNPTGYRRQSDLHFVSRKAAQPLAENQFLGATDTEGKDEAKYPTHSIFFQAPIGQTALTETATSSARQYRALSNMLSVVGYYIKWDEDLNLPKFILPNAATPDTALVPRRLRYRLMEVIQPGEAMMVYNNQNYTNLKYSDTGALTEPSPTPSPFKLPTDWVRVATGKLPPHAELTAAFSSIKQQDYSRILAENIVALIILPKVSERDRSGPDALNDLTDNFEYDSRPKPAFDSQALKLPVNSDLKNLANKLTPKQLKQLHQLPPILQVTMVAIDEASAVKLHDYSKAKLAYKPPTWFKDMTTDNQLTKVTNFADFQMQLGDPAGADPKSLIGRLSNVDGSQPTPKMNYRVFTTDVILRNSKWSK